jgi:hypothetical protein
MIDKHIKLDEAQNDRVKKSGKSIPGLLDIGVKAIEEQDDGLPALLFDMQNADSKQVYSYLKKLGDSDFSRRLVKEIYERGLQTQHRDLLVKIADSNSIYYVPLVEKCVGSLVSEESRLNAVRNEIESKIAERDGLIDEIDELVAERKTELEINNRIQKLETESQNISAQIEEKTGMRNKLFEEILELKKEKDSLITPIVKGMVRNWIGQEYTLGATLFGDAVWDYYQAQTDEERTKALELIVHFFRGVRDLSHVPIDKVIEIAEQVREAHPEFNQ